MNYASNSKITSLNINQPPISSKYHDSSKLVFINRFLFDAIAATSAYMSFLKSNRSIFFALMQHPIADIPFTLFTAVFGNNEIGDALVF